VTIARIATITTVKASSLPSPGVPGFGPKMTKTEARIMQAPSIAMNFPKIAKRLVDLLMAWSFRLYDNSPTILSKSHHERER